MQTKFLFPTLLITVLLSVPCFSRETKSGELERYAMVDSSVLQLKAWLPDQNENKDPNSFKVSYRLCNSSKQTQVVWIQPGLSWKSDKKLMWINDFSDSALKEPLWRNTLSPFALDPGECREGTLDGSYAADIDLAQKSFRLGFHPGKGIGIPKRPKPVWSGSVEGFWK